MDNTDSVSSSDYSSPTHSAEYNDGKTCVVVSSKLALGVGVMQTGMLNENNIDPHRNEDSSGGIAQTDVQDVPRSKSMMLLSSY